MEHQFLSDKGILLSKLRGLGFDGTTMMSRRKSGGLVRMHHHAPSALFVHYCSHGLRIAAAHACK